MDFAFTEEQEQIRKTAREFARQEIAPHVAEYDEQERFPTDIVRKAEAVLDLSPIGVLTALIPNETWPATPVERYADIYTARVSNFLYASPFAFLRSSRGSRIAPENRVADCWSAGRVVHPAAVIKRRIAI